MIVGLQYVKHFIIVGLRYVKHFMIVGLQYVKQLCVPEFNTVEMEVTSK